MNEEMSMEEIGPSIGAFLNPKNIHQKYLTQRAYAIYAKKSKKENPKDKTSRKFQSFILHAKIVITNEGEGLFYRIRDAS